jgi:glutamine amidotransferase
VKKALGAIEAKVFVPASPAEMSHATGVIVPGVGHFGATRAIDAEWTAAIRGLLREGRPLLGICLGMQWLFEGSDEAPDCPGLGVFPERCYRLRGDAGSAIKIPHVGWNSLAMTRDDSIVGGVAAASQVYFTHSYVAPVTADTVAQTEHGEAFAAIVQRGQIAGVQFHPEKSGDIGLRVLRNFIKNAG